MTVLIDSWSWIEYWRGGPYSAKAAKFIEGSEMALGSTINLTETYFWVLRHYGEKNAEEKRETLKKRCFLIPVDEEIAVEAARAEIGSEDKPRGESHPRHGEGQRSKGRDWRPRLQANT